MKSEPDGIWLAGDAPVGGICFVPGGVAYPARTPSFALLPHSRLYRQAVALNL